MPFNPSFSITIMSSHAHDVYTLPQRLDIRQDSLSHQQLQGRCRQRLDVRLGVSPGLSLSHQQLQGRCCQRLDVRLGVSPRLLHGRQQLLPHAPHRAHACGRCRIPSCGSASFGVAPELLQELRQHHQTLPPEAVELRHA